MERWPGHERQERTRTRDKSKDKGKQKGHSGSFWQWPHLEHGSMGRMTLVSKDGRVQWSSVVNTSHDTRLLPIGRPAKVFPETRPPRVNIDEHSAYRRAEEGMQYLRTNFPDTDFPGELLRGTLETDSREMRDLKAFDPLLGNVLEIIPCHHTQNESTVVFPMGQLGRELNISRFTSDESGNMVFKPVGSPSFVFETPILQISSAIPSSEWVATRFSSLLVRTHTSSSLLRLECSKITRELDITRSEAGDVPVVDSRILASGPDVVVVNRNGNVYKCNTYRGGKTMKLVGPHDGDDGDYFWQLGISRRNDECFLASCKAVKHIDLRSASPVADVFSLDHTSAIVTSFEDPVHDHINRVTTTSDVIWLDDRFRRGPLLSFRHYRSLDRTLKVLTANLDGASLSLLTSRRNSFVTLYDVSRGTDDLLHCNSVPSCLPHDGPMFTAYGGHALVASPSNAELAFFRLCQRGSIHRQDIRATPPGDQPGSVQENRVTHQWDEHVEKLEKQASQLKFDLGPAAGRYYIEVNLRDPYESIFANSDGAEGTMDENAFKDVLARLPDIWQDTEEIADNMLTTFDVICDVAGGNKHPPHIDSRQAFDTLMCGEIVTRKLTALSPWHYNIQDTSIPTLKFRFANCDALNEYLKELNLVSGVEGSDPSVQRETEAREQLVVDLALSNDVYSARQFIKLNPHATDEETRELRYNKEPPEVKFGYFRPVRKSGADDYANEIQEAEQEQGVSSPLGVRLLLAEWELGTDPDDYVYRDPYGLADDDEQPTPQYKMPPAAPTIQKKQITPQRPPTVVAAATQPPMVHTIERALPMLQTQPVQRTQSQQMDPGLNAFSQELVTSTQVLPGPFGSRPGTVKKPTKKRIGGF